ncbi:unnamed protein product [Prorocentrum cordatum]|uniref:Uncharacterized protein n=1 Tax=Prorocentrum cordatum TaxID=2364126 RepID=A0ABN9S3G9_9DINO|nr:unnamed protein product [Polarella glacialis]
MTPAASGAAAARGLGGGPGDQVGHVETSAGKIRFKRSGGRPPEPPVLALPGAAGRAEHVLVQGVPGLVAAAVVWLKAKALQQQRSDDGEHLPEHDGKSSLGSRRGPPPAQASSVAQRPLTVSGSNKEHLLVKRGSVVP